VGGVRALLQVEEAARPGQSRVPAGQVVRTLMPSFPPSLPAAFPPSLSPAFPPSLHFFPLSLLSSCLTLPPPAFPSFLGTAR